MKLTAKVNGVQQEIELSKEDVYVVECGNKEETIKVLKSIDVECINAPYCGYVSSKPIFIGIESEDYGSFVTDDEPISPNIPIISFEDWERLMEEKEPKPTKWRFKTQKEFDDTCEKNNCGEYKCGNDFFITFMFYLFGKEYAGSPDNLIRQDDWAITPEMLMPLEEVGETKEKLTWINMVDSKEYKQYPIHITKPPYKALLTIQTQPNFEIIFKDEVITIEQLQQILLNASVQSESAPTQKWEKLTRGGYEYHIYEEFDGGIFGRAKQHHEKKWHGINWQLDGKLYPESNNSWDLIPLNRESILKEIEDYENKIKELKLKL